MKLKMEIIKKLFLIIFCAFIPAGVFSYSYSTTVEWINMSCTSTTTFASCTLKCRFCGVVIATATSYSTSVNVNDYMHCCPGMVNAYFPGCTCAGNMPDCSRSGAGGSINAASDTYGTGFFTPNSQDETKNWLLSNEKKWEVLKRVSLNYGFDNPENYIMSYGDKMTSRDYWLGKMLTAYNKFHKPDENNTKGKSERPTPVPVKPAPAIPRVNPCNDPNVVCLDDGQDTVDPALLKSYDPQRPFAERLAGRVPSVIDEKRCNTLSGDDYNSAMAQAEKAQGKSGNDAGVLKFLADDMYSKVEGKVTDAGTDAFMDAISGGNENIKEGMGAAVEVYGIYGNIKNLDNAAKQGNEALGTEMNGQLVGYLSGKMKGVQGAIADKSINIIKNYTTNLTENVMQGLKKAGDIATNPNYTQSDINELFHNDGQ
ncbi:MAG: hypothetical protein CVV21_05560 [Candidatus Goldiibacteriota bacterium HGW-Goldbacteria-1]|jgi:hypothetical protein|nr:MAG: hypothetical protein CVV21_05560 [Candidatus Goldiibacteriota bacterium HGW-Goldbacteria-1]